MQVKCAHSQCMCAVPEGKEYCGAWCEQMRGRKHHRAVRTRDLRADLQTRGAASYGVARRLKK